MVDKHAKFVGDIPHYYDTGLGPNIFYDYADKLAKKCGTMGASHVVELAAGTGILSRRLRNILPAETRLVVTDLNQPMLEVAKGKFTAKDDVEFIAADAMNLPFEDEEFDLMVCQFGTMFFPDKPASYREAERVLRSGGHYIFNTWGPMSNNPFSQLVDDVAKSFFPSDPPGFYKVPFHYGDPVDVLADLTAAGWDDVKYEKIALNKTIKDPEAFAKALVYGNPFIDEINQRGGVDPEDVVAALLDALRGAFGAGHMAMPLQATTFQCCVSK